MVLHYENYIGSKRDNVEHIKALLSRVKTSLTLVKAPPGGGKTTVMMQAFKELSNENNEVYILAVPYKVQALQGSEKYKITCIVKGMKPSEEIKTGIAVYEKVVQLVNFYQAKGIKVNLVIDECHMLIDSAFRGSVMRDLIEVSKQCNVIHLSATPRLCLDYFNYDQCLEFRPSKVKDDYKTFIYNLPSKGKVESIASLILEQSKSHKFTMVRINNKSLIEQLKIELETLHKRVAIVYTSEEIENDEVFTNIVNNETVSSDYDILLTTSKLDCGINLDFDHTDVCVMVIPLTGIDYNMDSIEQFSKRARNGIKTLVVATCGDLNNPSNVDYNLIKETERDYCIKHYQTFKDSLEPLVQIMGIEHVRNMMQLKDLNDTSISDYCMSIDLDGHLYFDEIKLIKRADVVYSSNLYNNPYGMVQALRVHNIAEYSEVIDYSVVTKEVQRVHEEVKRTLLLTKKEKEKARAEAIQKLTQVHELPMRTMLEGEEIVDAEMQNAYNFLKEHYPKVISGVRKCIDSGYSAKEVFTSLAENGHTYHKTLLDASMYRRYNRDYKRGRLNHIQNGSQGKDYLFIREYIDEKKESCLDGRPSKTKEMIEDLTNRLNKEVFTGRKKISPKATNNALELIYNTDSKNRILSPKY